MAEKQEKLFVRMSPDLRGQIKAEADLRGESESLVVREALRKYFSQSAGVAALRETKSVAYRGKP